MRTLTILHTDAGRPEQDLERYLVSVPQWYFIRTSTANGGTKPYYMAVYSSVRVIPEEWTEADLNAFRTLWPHLLLSSFELPDADYAKHISRLQSRSIDKTRQVVRQR